MELKILTTDILLMPTKRELRTLKKRNEEKKTKDKNVNTNKCILLSYSAKCPAEWTYVVGTSSKCCQHFSKEKTWSQASENCQALGGELTTIENEVENRYILKCYDYCTAASTESWKTFQIFHLFVCFVNVSNRTTPKKCAMTNKQHARLLSVGAAASLAAHVILKKNKKNRSCIYSFVVKITRSKIGPFEHFHLIYEIILQAVTVVLTCN